MARFQETLRRLATIDEGFVLGQVGPGLGLAWISVPDPKTAALRQVGVSAALGSPAICLESSVGLALTVGASQEELADVLLAIAPVAGLGRVVATAPEVATALGYGRMLLDVRPRRMPRRRQGVSCTASSSISR